ncbi:MAG: DUF1080 domain-containing protein [Planctomycetota bacterium]|jgi:hypothetical protein|nr:DUF1080 domain-containing protein [Planctomycetota bacterium]
MTFPNTRTLNTTRSNLLITHYSLLLTLIPCFACSEDAWINLVADGGVSHWRTPGDWTEVGEVSKDPANERKLTVKEGKDVIYNGPRGRTRNLLSKIEHGDIEAHIEFMVPKGSNSGIYFMGRYEIQVLDSYGRKTVKHGDAGGIYQRWDSKRGKGKQGFEGHPPRVNASKAPGEWQTFELIFRAPRFGPDGQKTANGKFVKVVLNGQVIHENVEVTGPTRAATYRDEKPKGPIMLQGDHGPVAYRNIRIRNLKDE